MSSSNQEQAIALLKASNEGSFGTLEGNQPYVSATGYLYHEGGSFGKLILLLSDLARHARNAQKTNEVSFLVVEQNSDIPIHEKKRVSVQGKITRVEDGGKAQQLKDEYLKVFPKSEIFFTLADFRFYEIEIREVHWIGGFGKAATLK